MKARWGWRAVQGLAVLAMLLAGVILLAGCASNKKIDLLLAQTQEQSRRIAATEAVALELAKKNYEAPTVMPDILASVEPGSQVAWAHAKRCIRSETNAPLLDKDGNAQFETLQAVGKSRSGRDFNGLKRGRLKLAGMAWDFETGKIDPNALLEGATTEVVYEVGDSTVPEAWAKVWGDAVAAEKAAIISGMALLAKERGAAYAVKVEALGKGLATFVTAAGTVTGTILDKVAVMTPEGLAVAGVKKIIEAVVKSEDGTVTKVLTADTATSTAATECEGCSEPGN